MRTRFWEGYGVARGDSEFLAAEIQTSGKTTELPYPTTGPEIIERKTPAQPQEIRVEQVNVETRSWFADLEVPRIDIVANNLGIYNMHANALGEAARSFFDKQVFGDLVKRSGTDLLGGDGVPLFDDAHPVGGNNWSNQLGSGPSWKWILADSRSMLRPYSITRLEALRFQTRFDVNDPKVYDQDVLTWGARGYYGFGAGAWYKVFASDTDFTDANFYTALETIASWRDARDRPMNVQMDTLYTGWGGRKAAIETVGRETDANGAENINRGMIKKLVVTSWLD